MTPLKCVKCGNENRQGSRFCRFCGGPLADSPPGSPPATVRPPSHSQPTVRRVHPSASQTLSSSAPTVRHVYPSEPPPQPSPVERAPTGEGEQPSPPFPARERGAAIQNITGGLGPGDLLQNRYRITAVLSQEADSTLYEAEDLLRCWSCGALQPNADLRFCEDCGAELSQKPAVRLREVAAPGKTAQAGEGEFWEEGRLYRLEESLPAARVTPSPGLRLVAGYLSDTGRVREVDEDSLLILQLTALCEARHNPALSFFAVADGIGGHSAGEVASRAAVRSLAEGLARRIFLPVSGGETILPENLTSHLVEAIKDTHRAILAMRRKQGTDMGCTLTAALVYDSQAIVANVGDSRTYLMRGGKLTQITKDHSVLARLIAAGMAQPEEAYAHTEKGVIYRSLGDKPEVEVDTFPLELQAGDRLLLCCDGLWEMVRDPVIEDALLENPNPQAACSRLVALANLGGGEDNISVIVVDVQ